MSLGSPKSQRASITQVLLGEGMLPAYDRRSLNVARSHWQNVFDGKDVDRCAMHSFLERYARPVYIDDAQSVVMFMHFMILSRQSVLPLLDLMA